jgi:molybdopterin/thiamine biosynthesis adenylyltransferase
MKETRYSRNEGLFGAEGQRLIGETKVTIVGLGGLGCHIAQQTAHLGVVDYRLVDDDYVTESSLNRLVGARPDDVDMTTKVAVSARVVRAIQPAAWIDSIHDVLESRDGTAAIENADIVFGCLDRDLHRLSLTERCIEAGVPFFDLASDTDVRAGLAYGGRVLFSGDRERCPWCMDLVDQEQLRKDTMTPATRAADERIYGVSQDALHGTGPAVVSINAVVASLAVTEFMAWRTGLRSPNRILTYRADQGGVRPSRDMAREGCPYCQSAIGRLAS